MIRRLMFGAFMTGFVILGLVAQAGAYLLALPSPIPGKSTPGAEIGAFSQRGEKPVGLRRLTADEAPIPLTLWYPAVEPETDNASLTYSYAMNILGADSSVALATYQGQADPGAEPDLSSGPYPVVVLSHGFAITSGSYGWLAEHLASHGLVVVAPQHDESLDPGMLWRSTIDRPRNVLSALSYLEEQARMGGRLDGLINSGTVGVIGHSYGGYTALTAGGGRLHTGEFQSSCRTSAETDDTLTFLCDALLPRLRDMADLAGHGSVPAGLWPAWVDPRVDAVVTIAGDAAMFGQAGLAEISIPVMAIGGTADTDSPFEWGTQYTYNHVGGDRNVEIALDGAQHMIFAGECDSARRILRVVSLGFCSDPAWDRQPAHDLVKHYATAFLLAELKQDPEAAGALAPDRQRLAGVTYHAKGY